MPRQQDALVSGLADDKMDLLQVTAAVDIFNCISRLLYSGSLVVTI